MSAQLRIQKALVIALFVALLTTQVFASPADYMNIVKKGKLDANLFNDSLEYNREMKKVGSFNKCFKNYAENKKYCTVRFWADDVQQRKEACFVLAGGIYNKCLEGEDEKMDDFGTIETYRRNNVRSNLMKALTILEDN